MSEELQIPNQLGGDKKRPTPKKRAKKGKTAKKGRKTFVLQRLRRQDIILLIGLFSLACFSIIVVALLIIRFQSGQAAQSTAGQVTETPGPQPTHTVTYTQVTGLSQYRLAEAEARAWAGDAQLVSANANWPRVLNQDQVGEPETWTYHFYSPSKEHLFIVNVQPDNRTLGFEHVVRITLPPPLLGTESWVVDSPAALAIWLDNGGADMVRTNPGLEMIVQLRHLRDYPNPVWMVIGSDQRTEDIHIIVVDTTEGKVVKTGSVE